MLSGFHTYFFRALAFAALLLFASCANEESGPYNQVLAQPDFASITDSIRKMPDNDSLYFRRAVLLNQKNFPEVALADFKQAWTISPREVYAYAIGNLLLLKEPQESISFITAAAKKIEPSGRMLLTLAQAYL